MNGCSRLCRRPMAATVANALPKTSSRRGLGAVAQQRSSGDHCLLLRPATAGADSPPSCPRRDLVRRMKIPAISQARISRIPCLDVGGKRRCIRWVATSSWRPRNPHQRIAIPDPIPSGSARSSQSSAPSPGTKACRVRRDHRDSVRSRRSRADLAFLIGLAFLDV